MAIDTTTDKFIAIKGSDGKQKLVIHKESGEKDQVLMIDMSTLTGSGSGGGGLDRVSTWNEFADKMKLPLNYGKLYFIEDAEEVDGLPSGESVFAYIIDGSAYELIRTYEGLYAWVQKFVEDKEVVLKNDIDINTEDIYSLEQLLNQMQDALNNIENIWKGDQHFNMVGSDGQYNLSTLKTDGNFGGDKGAFDFTAGKRIYVKLTNGNVNKVYDLKVGATPVDEVMGRATFKLQVDASGVLHITDFTGNGKNITDTTITELEQSKNVSITSPEDLIDFNEDIIYHVNQGSTSGDSLEYKDVATGLTRVIVNVDAITGVGVDTFTYKTNFDIKARIKEQGTNFGGTFELDGSSVAYSNPTASGKNFIITGAKGTSYKVYLKNDKIVIELLGGTGVGISIDGVAILPTDPGWDGTKWTIDNPSDYWNDDGMMKITFTTNSGTLTDGQPFLRLSSKVHPHNLKAYAWQTMEKLGGEFLEDIYSIETTGSTSTGLTVSLFKNGFKVSDTVIADNKSVTIPFSTETGHIVSTSFNVIRADNYNATDKTHIIKNVREQFGFKVETRIPSNATAKGTFEFKDDGNLTITTGTYSYFQLLQGSFIFRQRPPKIVESAGVTTVYEFHFNPSTPGGTDGKVDRVEMKKVV